MRRYFLILNTFSEQTLSDFAIPSSVSEHAQKVFIEVRKEEHDASGGKELQTTADTFHQWLTLARLIAISEGKLELTNEIFDRAHTMEKERMARLPKVSGQKQ